MRRAAVAPGPEYSRYERPRAVRRSRPDVPSSPTRLVRSIPPRRVGHSPILRNVEPRPLDPRLVDDARAEEIALVARLLLAARHEDRPLSQAVIDEALGVDGPAEAPEDGAAEGAAEDSGTDEG